MAYFSFFGRKVSKFIAMPIKAESEWDWGKPVRLRKDPISFCV